MHRVLLALVLSFAALPAAAGYPEDTVRWIYASLTGLGTDKGLAYLSAPERRAQYFSRRIVSFYEADETYTSQGQMGCIDFGLEVSGQDFNAAEIDRTLTISSEDKPGRRIVTASFSNFGQVVRVAYTFVEEDGYWRIDNIAGPGWRLSDMACESRGEAEAKRQEQAKKKGDKPAGPAYTAGAADYCYRTPGDTLRMSVSETGTAAFRLESAQPAGHKCTAEGEAAWTGDGWLFARRLASGECRMEILITAEQGLRLTDTDATCKATFCGPSAKLDGLTFPRGAQMDCAYLPAK